MPPQSKVPVEDAINVLIRYINYFASDQLPEWSSDVWEMMAKEPEFVKKWDGKCVRTNIYENRRDILIKAREKCGYFIPMRKKNVDYKDDEDEVYDEDKDDDKNDQNYYSDVYCNQQKNLASFEVKLSRHLWDSIQKTTPIIENDCNYPGLQPKVWTDVLALEFWKQHRLKCAFVFKKGAIHQYGHYYATMIGRCKSKKCQNYLFGYIENNPPEHGDVIVKMNCRDTRFEKHDDCLRPLRGERRQMMKKEIKNKGVKASIKDAAQKLLDPGDTQCPLMLKSNVLYQLKKEIVEGSSSVKSIKNCCVASCGSRKSTLGNETFHTFPINDHLKSVWMKNIGVDNIRMIYKTKMLRVCGKHFEEKYKRRGKYVTLVPNAVPTLHVSGNVTTQINLHSTVVVLHDHNYVTNIVEAEAHKDSDSAESANGTHGLPDAFWSDVHDIELAGSFVIDGTN